MSDHGQKRGILAYVSWSIFMACATGYIGINLLIVAVHGERQTVSFGVLAVVFMICHAISEISE